MVTVLGLCVRDRCELAVATVAELECLYALFQRGLMSCLSKWLTFLVLFSTIFSYCGAGEMDALSCEGIHADMPKTKLVAKVSRLPVEIIL